jgi:hypothetical protein
LTICRQNITFHLSWRLMLTMIDARPFSEPSPDSFQITIVEKFRIARLNRRHPEVGWNWDSWLNLRFGSSNSWENRYCPYNIG